MEALFAAIDRGDRAALEKLLSTAWRGYAIGSPEPRAVIDREEAIAYFAERPRVGERLALASIAVVPYLSDGHVDFQITVHRQLRELRVDHDGKGAIYCGGATAAHGIMVLALGDGR